MITIIRTRTLAELREEVALIPQLRRQVAASRHEAATAAADAARLAAELEAAITATAGRLGRLMEAVRVPVAGRSVQADIALHVVRDMIAEAKASGDAAAIEGIRIMDALLGEDAPLSFYTRPAVRLSTAAPQAGPRLPSTQEGTDEHH